MAKSILLLNRPNLNLLGTREPHLYGSTTLSDVESSLSTYLSSHNPPGALIDRVHEARGTVDAIIINAGGLTHTSVALRGALAGVDIPFVEVHVTNVHARESFRHLSFLSEKAAAVICGLGTYGYKAAAEFCIEHLNVRNRS
ncbi:Dehydroquinase [Xylogone sp. PMI_703]|nr:Dehydroquinase [Xylogone sp. PMI_703]